MADGDYTGKLGKELSEFFEHNNLDFTVYYDHGDPSEDNVCVITPFFGEFSRDNSLANTDIAIIDNKTNKLVLLSEVEESSTPPKKVIGDILSVFLADKVRIRNKAQDKEEFYPIEDINFIIGIKVDYQEKAEKLKELAKRTEQAVNPELAKKAKVIVIAEDQVERLISGIKKKMLSSISVG